MRRDQQATSSKDCLWPYSVGMLRPSWGVPPAQVDFSLTVCYVLPINLIILHMIMTFCEFVIVGIADFANTKS